MSGKRGRIFSTGFASTPGNSFLYLPGGNSSGWQSLREVEYDVLAIWIQLVCDASVANRYIRLELLNTTSGFGGFNALGTVTTAGLTTSLAFVKGSPLFTTGVTLPGAVDHCFGHMTFQYPQTVKISVTGGVVGDAITGLAIMREIAS